MILLISQFNSTQHIFKLIKSIDLTSCRLVVVNHSEDNHNIQGVDFININKSVSLSKSRNIALNYCVEKGYFKECNFIMFPDDDAAFSEDFWENIDVRLNQTSLFNVEDNGKIMFKWWHYGYLSYKNVMSSNIVINIKDFKNFRFDENLGIGSKFGSGEDLDLFWSIGDKKFNLLKDIFIHHTLVSSNYRDINDQSRLNKYFLGHLKVCQKHNRILPVVFSLFIPIARIMLFKSFNHNFKIFKNRLKSILKFNRKI